MKDITNYRDKEWESKLKKIKNSSDLKDWHNIKNILGFAKLKIEYPKLKLGNKKASIDKKKPKLLKQFLGTIFSVEPEHRTQIQKDY